MIEGYFNFVGEQELMFVCQTSHAQIKECVVSFLQGFGAASQETGAAILPGLPGADPHRAACPESGLCNARVHTVRVGTLKNLIVQIFHMITSCTN